MSSKSLVNHFVWIWNHQYFEKWNCIFFYPSIEYLGRVTWAPTHYIRENILTSKEKSLPESLPKLKFYPNFPKINILAIFFFFWGGAQITTPPPPPPYAYGRHFFFFFAFQLRGQLCSLYVDDDCTPPNYENFATFFRSEIKDGHWLKVSEISKKSLQATSNTSWHKLPVLPPFLVCDRDFFAL